VLDLEPEQVLEQEQLLVRQVPALALLWLDQAWEDWGVFQECNLVWVAWVVSQECMLVVVHQEWVECQ
jgi:hypothetical protein